MYRPRRARPEPDRYEPDRYEPDRYEPDRYEPDRYEPDRYEPDRWQDDSDRPKCPAVIGVDAQDSAGDRLCELPVPRRPQLARSRPVAVAGMGRG